MPGSDPTGALPTASESAPPVSETSEREVNVPRPPSPPPLPDAIGPYKVRRRLGAGGMGVVYLAEQSQPHREVALKVMRPGTVTPERLWAFRREADVLGRFQHDGIAHIYDAGQVGEGDQAQPYLVMELIDGRPLTVFADAARLDVRGRVSLMVKVCEAVGHAHEKGVIHGDLKPGNILVTADGKPKVLDFGLAQVSDGNAPATDAPARAGQVAGTLPYMSPELASGAPGATSPLSDVYALGVILYELLAGRRPYDLKGKKGLEALEAIAAASPGPLGRVNRACRGDLTAIAARALEREPARRYRSAEEMARDLERYLKDEPVEARHGGRLYRAWKGVRRNRWRAVAVAAVCAAAVVGAWGWVERERAGIERARADLVEKEKARAGFVHQAEAAAEKGDWREAAENYEKAAAGHPDAVALRLKRCHALLAINDVGRCRDEVEALAAAPDLGELEGPVTLLRGELRLGRDNPEAERLIRRAQRIGLPPGQAAYAEALLAPSSSGAVVHLQRALALAADQPRARRLLALLLIALGRLDEARIELKALQTRYPEDVNGTVLRAFLLALQRDPGGPPADKEGPEGDLAAANAVLDGLRGRLDDEDIAALRAIVRVCCELRNPANKPDPETGLPNLTKHLAILAGWFPRLWRVPLDVAVDGGALPARPTLGELMPLPQQLYAGFGGVSRALLRLEKAGKFPALDVGALDELERAVRAHPEGTLLYLRALVFMAGMRFEDAREAALEAADAPALLLPVRQSALLTTALADVYGYTQDKSPTRRRRIVEALRRLRDAAPDGVPFNPSLAVRLAGTFEEHPVGRLVLDNWQKQAPNDPQAQYYRAWAELKAKNYGAAIEAADRLLRQPPDEGAAAPKLRQDVEKLKKEAIEELKKQARCYMDGPDRR
jgi:tetratricopeptide (TPR) repeat protein